MERANKESLVFVTTNHYEPTGGSEVLWSETAKLLLDDGHAVGACSRDWRPLPEHLQDLVDVGCDLHRIADQKDTLPAKAIQYVGRRLGHTQVKKFGDWLSARQPRLVMFSMGNSVEGFHLIRECQARNLPYAILIQLVSEHNWLDDQASNELIDIYRGAKTCFFVSEGNRQLVERMVGARFANAEIVQNPYTVPFEQEFRWPSFDGVYQVACVANLHSFHKGQDLLLDVIRAEKWKQRPIAFNLYGRGPHKEILQRLKDSWAVENLHFHGFVSDISDVWATNHALVMPSRMEGMPLALKEAMLSGRVPIVTDVGGNSELVDDDVNGFLAKAPSAELLDEALERAWARKEDWQIIGRQAFEDAHRRISPQPIRDFADRLLNICDLTD